MGPHLEFDGKRVDHLDAIRPLLVVGPVRRVRKSRLGIDGTLERIRDIVGISQFAVVPVNVVSDVKRDLASVVRHLPRFRKIGLGILVLVVLHQGHEVDEALVLRRGVVLRNVIVHPVGDVADRSHDHRTAMTLRRRHLSLELGHISRDISRDFLTKLDTRPSLGQ